MKPFVLLPAVLLACSGVLPNCAFAGSATWNLNPSGDWNIAANWTPATVPNDKSDTATFSLSNTTSVSPSDKTIVDGINFAAGASAFTVTIIPQRTFTISGAGIRNDSGVVQNLVMDSSDSGAGTLVFTDSARVGSMVAFTNNASHGGHDGHGGYVSFQDTASAGNGTFRNLTNELGGRVEFFGSSTADHASFVNDVINNASLGGTVNFLENSTAGSASFLNSGGYVQFYDTSTADHGTFTCAGSQAADAGGGAVWFYESSTAGEATLTAEGGSAAGRNGGFIRLESGTDSGNATFIANGGQVSGALGGHIDCIATSGSATFIINGATVSGAFGGTLTVFPGQDNATLIANSGSNGGTGGEIDPIAYTIGGRIELFGNAWLNFADNETPTLTAGSIEGSGRISLVRYDLTTGSNNLSTTFSGLIEDGDSGRGGSFTKVGSGNLTLTDANTYTGGTTVTAGILLVNNTSGSGTGSGPVLVTAGTFGGGGKISGSVAVGTGSGIGAFLGPGATGVIPGTLTIRKKLTLMADATYKVTMNSSSVTADKVSAKGVKIRGAQILLDDRATSLLPPGTIFTVINNTAATPIAGTFANLSDGGTIKIGNNTFQANYEGGDGNDLTVTVVSN